MQTIRGTKDILPNEIQKWQTIYSKALELCNIYNYSEIRTPIIEATELFTRSIGDDTDIVSKEMYSFIDQGKRDITLRPEGTACVARAFISNKLYINNSIQKLWYMGPMFRYERPQSGRQRQFHQLGLECIGSDSPLADAEIIYIVYNLLNNLHCMSCRIELNSIGNIVERTKYQEDLVQYISKFKSDLDVDSQQRISRSPLRIFDSKDIKTQFILKDAPCLTKYLGKHSIKHFELVCQYLDILDVSYTINTHLVRGLDYYNDTAFEIVSDTLGSQNTICGGGRYNNLIRQLGGPHVSGVGCAIGIERLLMVISNQNTEITEKRFYIITQGFDAQKKALHLVQLFQKNNLKFHLEVSNGNLSKRIKKAVKNSAFACILLGQNEVDQHTVTIKWIATRSQETISYNNIIEYIKIKLTDLSMERIK